MLEVMGVATLGELVKHCIICPDLYTFSLEGRRAEFMKDNVGYDEVLKPIVQRSGSFSASLARTVPPGRLRLSHLLALSRLMLCF
jgi:hypothetical protein